ncbi:YihY/virulence factor BrkB family protein [Actinophytocola sp.]|jgi:membrane protein|uniref:YihY/virulence factor BrkB family protein n=1 Tax=Actinophytocola sp. TaxID=1872138 RepID=UPI002ED9E0AA
MAEQRGDTNQTPGDLPRHAWWAALKRTVREFVADDMPDWAAALTYYSVMSIFPAIVVLMAGVGLLGTSATRPLIENVQQLAPGQARDTVVNVIRQLEDSGSVAGPVAVVGLLGALWAASAYVGGFIRASNAIYDIEEGRPAWKTLPLRVALTLAMVILLAVSAIGVVLTGTLAERVGNLLGIGSTGVLVWNIAKWPVLALLISLAIALLYWASPNVRHPGFRWVTPGSAVAVLLWVVASLGFAFYVANFASYNKVYGSLAGVVVFLVWLWISNLAILLGAELDAELARGRQIERGMPEGEEPFLAPRDTRAMD